MVEIVTEQLIKQLLDKSSKKRRVAAKKLRKLGAIEAGPALISAIQNEVKDKRTWETLYQMIMALGESRYIENFEFLFELAEKEFESTMVYVAIGDAITRLDFKKNESINISMKIFCESDNPMLIDGILRAIAMLKLVPDNLSIDRIVDYGQSLGLDDNSRVWIAAAAPAWNSSKVQLFLNQSVNSENQQVKRAATAALNKKYLKWSPL